MPASQFTIFSSSDVGGPGLLTGQAGSLLTLLDACLVTGYSGHSVSPAWTKPFANSGNIGCYKQGAGAGLGLVINDNGPNGTASYREAWAIGWESVAGIGAPVGTGSGQFPTPAQQLTTGHVVWRKSSTADSAGRYWIMFADSSTFYLFISTGDSAGRYYIAVFGDIFSLKGSSDAYRCMIMGRMVENNSGGGSYNYDVTDGIYTSNGSTSGGPLAISGNYGHYIARTWGGGGSSVVFNKLPDLSKMNAPYGLSFIAFVGILQTPNGPDNSLYLSPVSVVEPSGSLIRGRLRGVYMLCHPIANFTDGQTFAGGGDFAGKSFVIVLQGPGGGFFAMETSATVETN